MADIRKTPIGKYYIGMMRGSYRIWMVQSKSYEDGNFVGATSCHTSDMFWSMQEAYERMCQLNGWEVKGKPEIKPVEREPYYVVKIKRAPKDGKQFTIYFYGGTTEHQARELAMTSYNLKENDEMSMKLYT